MARPAIAGLLFACGLAMACAGVTEPPDGPRDFAPSTPQELDREAIALVAGAQKLARPDGCAEAAACRCMELGERACGGPLVALTYCGATTNETALETLRSEIARVQALCNLPCGDPDGLCIPELCPKALQLRDRGVCTAAGPP